MSESTPPPETLNPQGPVPGCGLAAYAALLMTICVAGVVGIVLSTQAMLTQEPDSISQLVHGSQVQTWRLQPMRDAGLLELTEVPLAWHDESFSRDGSAVCALTPKGIAALHDNAVFIPFPDVIKIDTQPKDNGGLTVAIHGAQGTATCEFGPLEGGERMVRQIEIEQRKNAH